MLEAILLAATILAQVPSGPHCDSRTDLVQLLKSRYGEEQTWTGITVEGIRIELYSSDNTATWSLLATKPPGRVTCIIASGGGSRHRHKAGTKI